MILKFQIDDITSKDADDLVAQLMQDIKDNYDIMVTDYWVEEE